ncbi:PepSY domain-containing protein [Xiamenia xianingshaonis]|uniref:PepSY domain-containing protein n=1 Tax=Xiamenia xianingshaonis TaxID=2682776 RepID=A0A9E6STY5_9ACTN|nr:PepSY domain-containing protein [Xiamenia xianingshaonis]NHM14070.1 hypothetical protein [Xiamenia xianingshaonis]QTU83935.1 PepSY domain-containing protein [Xiamenia xianingshaonis]
MGKNQSASLHRTLPTLALSALLGVVVMTPAAGCASGADNSGSTGGNAPAEAQQKPASDQQQDSASATDQNTQERAATGADDKSMKDAGNAQGADGIMSQDEALDVALAEVGLTAADVTVTKNALEVDDGIETYDIEFASQTDQFDFTINAKTGAVLERKVEAVSTTSGNVADAIPEDEAKTIAAERAGVPEGSATFTEVKLEQDDGVAVYDITLTDGTTKYECTLDAKSGQVIDFSSEAIQGSAS